MRRILSLLLVSAVLSGCSWLWGADEEPQEPDTTPITLGFIGPLTGDHATLGQEALRGVHMALEKYNAAGGVDGRSFILIPEDGKCRAEDAQKVAEKLVHIDKVAAIIGGQCNEEMAGIAPVTEAAQTLVLTPIATHINLTDATAFTFRLYPSHAVTAKIMARYFEDDGIASVALLTEGEEQDPFRVALTQQLPEEVELVFDEVVPPGTKDVRTNLQALQEVDIDSFVPNTSNVEVLAAMVQQFREAGYDADILTHDTADSVTFIEQAKEAAEGMLFISAPSVGGDEFVERYEKQFGMQPTQLVALVHAFDAAATLLESMRSVGIDAATLRNHLRTHTFHGLIGTFTFDETGDIVGLRHELKEIADGTIETVDTLVDR